VEKVQQALDKARQARAALTGAEPVGGRPSSFPEPPPLPTTRGDGALRITYRHTRVVAASRDVLRRHRVIAADANEVAADAFRILRAQILSRLEARRGNTFVVCAANQAEGKTLVAANLALSLARHLNRCVLLVDLDLRNPSVHRCFGLRPDYGLSDVLLGRQTVEACLINPGIERLVLLPQATPVVQSSELLASPTMAALARELKERYRNRIVVYDCPALLATDEPLIAADFTDGCLLVVREGKTRRADFQRAVDLIGKERLLGTVLNDARWSDTLVYYYKHHG
jgi:protein-tyrosine kinase